MSHHGIEKRPDGRYHVFGRWLQFTASCVTEDDARRVLDALVEEFDKCTLAKAQERIRRLESYRDADAIHARNVMLELDGMRRYANRLEYAIRRLPITEELKEAIVKECAGEPGGQGA